LNAAGPSDRLVIDGGAATGKTSVQVTNLGGLGALTSGNGIEVITAQNGATTTAQTTKMRSRWRAATWTRAPTSTACTRPMRAGAGENWFLRSTTNAVTPTTPARRGPRARCAGDHLPRRSLALRGAAEPVAPGQPRDAGRPAQARGR
jgi:fibronectin-binding autotransporter adhesin